MFFMDIMKGFYIETLWIGQSQQRPANALNPGIHQIVPSKYFVFTGEQLRKATGTVFYNTLSSYEHILSLALSVVPRAPS